MMVYPHGASVHHALKKLDSECGIQVFETSQTNTQFYELTKDDAWAFWEVRRRGILHWLGLVSSSRPYEAEPGRWIVETGLTNLGSACLSALNRGLVWDTDTNEIDLKETERWWRNRISVGISDTLLSQINRITHPDLQGVVKDALMAKMRMD